MCSVTFQPTAAFSHTAMPGNGWGKSTPLHGRLVYLPRHKSTTGWRNRQRCAHKVPWCQVQLFSAVQTSEPQTVLCSRIVFLVVTNTPKWLSSPSCLLPKYLLKTHAKYKHLKYSQTGMTTDRTSYSFISHMYHLVISLFQNNSLLISVLHFLLNKINTFQSSTFKPTDHSHHPEMKSLLPCLSLCSNFLDFLLFLLVLLSSFASSSLTTWPLWVWIPQDFGPSLLFYQSLYNLSPGNHIHLQTCVKMSHKFLSKPQTSLTSSTPIVQRQLALPCPRHLKLNISSTKLSICLRKLVPPPVFPDFLMGSIKISQKTTCQFYLVYSSWIHWLFRNHQHLILPSLGQAISISLLKKFNWST